MSDPHDEVPRDWNSVPLPESVAQPEQPDQSQSLDQRVTTAQLDDQDDGA